jgi:simple sugar transport system permease protein
MSVLRKLFNPLSKLSNFLGTRFKFLENRPKLRWFLIGVSMLESIVLFLYIVNLLFLGYTDPLYFHVQVWQRFLSTNTWRLMLTFAMPLALTAVGATFNERVGVINIGLEGIMIWGAFAGVYITFVTGNPWIGVLGAALFGLINALLHAVLTITFKAEQIVTGVAINLLAAGMTEVLTTLIWNPGRSDQITNLAKWAIYDIPGLGTIFGYIRLKNYFDVPVLGTILRYIPDPIDALSGHSGLFYVAIVLIILAQILLFKTSIGLRFRVIGEHPQTAATAGIPVRRYQYYAVLISGLFAGLGGGIISIGMNSSFTSGMIGGRGFIALAAMIFGKWTVIGSVLAAMFFAYFYAIAIRVSGGAVQNFNVPPQFLQMMPFIVSIIALAGFIGKARPPKAIGKPYSEEED